MSTTALQFVITARDNASKTLDGIGAAAERQGSRFDGLKAKAGIALAAVGALAIKAAGDSVAAASDLSETLNKANVIFGDNASAVEKWADSAATSVGLSKAAALEAAASYGNMFQQLGFAGQQATDMSTSVVQLAADLGSFNNLGTDEVMDKLSGAFRGEYDSLQALIPNINAARVEQEALAMTGKTSAAELNGAEKAAATLAIVQRDGAAAANDFAETSTGLANSQKIAAAQAQDLQAKFGTMLLPVVQKLVGVGVKVLDWLNNTPGAMTAVAVALGAMAVAWAAMTLAASPWLAIGAAIAVVIAGVVLAIKNWGSVVEWLKGVWGNISGWFSGVFDGVKRVFTAFVSSVSGIFQGIVRVITFPFRTAFNTLASIWNNGPGRVVVDIPSWVPGLGGKTFAIPKLPTIPAFATGVQNFSGGYALVGEEGPEVVGLPRGSDVYPTGVNPAGTVNNYFTISETTSPEATAKQVARVLDTLVV